MTDPSLAARLRDVLSDEILNDAYVMRVRGDGNCVLMRTVLENALLPLLLSLQEEQRREIRNALEPLAKQLIDWRTDDEADDMDTTDMICEVGDDLTALISRLASSSSASARREQE